MLFLVRLRLEQAQTLCSDKQLQVAVIHLVYAYDQTIQEARMV